MVFSNHCCCNNEGKIFHGVGPDTFVPKKIVKIFRSVWFRIESNFENQTNFINAIFSMTLHDKKTFPCDFGEVCWSDYRNIYIYKGIVETLLNDKSDKATLERNARKMKFMHYSVVALFVLCVSTLIFIVFGKIFL